MPSHIAASVWQLRLSPAAFSTQEGTFSCFSNFQVFM
jgi:hypothetical protein